MYILFVLDFLGLGCYYVMDVGIIMDWFGLVGFVDFFKLKSFVKILVYCF